MFKTEPHEAKSLRWWYERRDRIDFDPVYQRHGGIWSLSDRAFLIDSILNQYDIPKIYMADFRHVDSPLNKAKKMYAIIDGKQRFLAIFDFFDDKLPLARDFEYSKDTSLELAGLQYSDLVERYPQVRKQFDEYELQVTSVVTDEKGKIENMFIRLNKALRPLSGAELRNALPGIVPILIRDLAEHEFFDSKIKFEVIRYQDREAAAKLLLVEFNGKLVSSKKKDLDSFVKQVPEERGPSTTPYREAAMRVTRVLNSMARVFRNRDPLLGWQGVIPVYYWIVRECRPGLRKRIHPFLVEFERKRVENDRREREKAPGVDAELLAYSTDRRSPNDGSAMKRMYELLEARFARFRAGSR